MSRLSASDRRRIKRRLRPNLLMLEDRKLLSTIVVNNPTDTPVAGQTDLRQAITHANTNGGMRRSPSTSACSPHRGRSPWAVPCSS